MAKKPIDERVVRLKRGKHVQKNPMLMVISNPVPSPAEIEKAEKEYEKFHYNAPAEALEAEVPSGWPQVYIVIGDLLRMDVDTGGRVVKREFGGRLPKLCTTAERRQLFIFGASALGIPSGRGMRVDYRVPKDSGRRKWSQDWTHPHDSKPRVTAHPSGRAVRIRGSKLKVTERGIEG